MNAPAANMPAPGQIVGGKYRLLALLGSGGMGTVFRAENTWTTRQVALKIMRTELSSNPDAVARFMREARSSARIAHPNIVDVLDMGQDKGTGAFYIVQELLTGADLRHRLDRVARLTPIEALEIIVPIMGALVAAARRGIVHRDIKPENIFLARTPNGPQPKLIDFGISKIVDDPGAASNTRTGFTMGTPNYMSPEQARGDSNVDERSDVWSIGVVLYEMLSGVSPFDDRTPNLVLVKILRDRPKPLDALVSDLPPWLVAAVHRALEYDREDRFASMHAFLAELLAHEVASAGPGEHTLTERFEDSLRDHHALSSGEAAQVEEDDPTEVRGSAAIEHPDGDDGTLVTPAPARSKRASDGIVSLPSAALADMTLPPASSGWRDFDPQAAVAVAAAMSNGHAPAAQVPPPAVPLTPPVFAPGRRRALLQRWLPALLGAAVALIALIVLVATRGGSPSTTTTTPQVAPPATSSGSSTAPPSVPRAPSPPDSPVRPQNPATTSGDPTAPPRVRSPSNAGQPPRHGQGAVRPPSIARRDPTGGASAARDAGVRTRPCGPLQPCARYP